MKKNILKSILEKLGFAAVRSVKSPAENLQEREESAEQKDELVESGWVSADKNTQNIEKYKASELKRFSSEQLLRMFESIDDLVVFIDKALNIKYITPFHQGFFGI